MPTRTLTICNQNFKTYQTADIALTPFYTFFTLKSCHRHCHHRSPPVVSAIANCFAISSSFCTCLARWYMDIDLDIIFKSLSVARKKTNAEFSIRPGLLNWGSICKFPAVSAAVSTPVSFRCFCRCFSLSCRTCLWLCCFSLWCRTCLWLCFSLWCPTCLWLCFCPGLRTCNAICRPQKESNERCISK